jgi:hypothetical protein
VNPYKNLPERSFWSPAVAQKSLFEILEIWDPKHSIGKSQKVSTYGSCFAQHIGRALRARGYHWLVTEPGPAMMTEETAREFNYGIFTARTGNIYTTSLLLQWVSWAVELSTPPTEIWVRNGRFYDPFRPNIEPEGFESADELLESRQVAIVAFRQSITDSDTFVFTLGLTESWVNKTEGYEYPMCPGVVAGEYNPAQHAFVNQDYPLIRQNLSQALRIIKRLNPAIKVLLTVSPVPLTATYSARHVLVANTASKSILRSVADNLAHHIPFVDYFPSYEIITAPPFKGVFYEPNLRNVTAAGVSQVMAVFFECLTRKFPAPTARPERRMRAGQRPGPSTAGARKVLDVCEEEFLAAQRKET